MVSKVTYTDITNRQTNGESGAALVNDTKRAINEVIDLVGDIDLGGVGGSTLPVFQPRQLGDGVKTTFNTPATGSQGAKAQHFDVYLNYVYQRPELDFSIDGATGDLTFLDNATPYAPNLNDTIDIKYVKPYSFDTSSDTPVEGTGTGVTKSIGDWFGEAGPARVTATGTTTPISLADRFGTGFQSLFDIGGSVDNVALGVQPVAGSKFVLRSDSNEQSGIAATAQIQRFSREDEGYTNPKALRVYTLVEGANPMTEWAISGEIDNYSTSTSTGNTAVSGVARKYTTASVFAGHFQCRDSTTYTVDTDVTPCVGIEVNQVVKGPDHPTANNGAGQRLLLDLIPISDSDGDPEGSGQVGTAIRIRADGAARSNGSFRYGIRIEDGKDANPESIRTGILIDNNGPIGINFQGSNTIASALFSGNPVVGAAFNGSYSSGSAIRIATGQAIGWESTNAIKQLYDSSTGSIVLKNSTVEKFAFNMGVTPSLSVNGVKVLGIRQPAIANATDAASAITQLNALLSAIRVHGLIET